jgi:hypothetical protein
MGSFDTADHDTGGGTLRSKRRREPGQIISKRIEKSEQIIYDKREYRYISKTIPEGFSGG